MGEKRPQKPGKKGAKRLEFPVTDDNKAVKKLRSVTKFLS